jgi:hypothetical protein
MATTSTTQKQTRAHGAGAPSATDTNPRTTSGPDGEEARGIGDELRQLVRDKAYEQIGSQKERATGTLGAVAGAVRNVTQDLRDRGQPGVAAYVSRAADEIDRWTSRLREQDLDEAMRDVQQFARRKPAIFLGVAFGAGVLAARFFKSSRPAGPAFKSPRSAGTLSSSSSYSERPSVAHDAPNLAGELSATREGF